MFMFQVFSTNMFTQRGTVVKLLESRCYIKKCHGRAFAFQMLLLCLKCSVVTHSLREAQLYSYERRACIRKRCTVVSLSFKIYSSAIYLSGGMVVTLGEAWLHMEQRSCICVSNISTHMFTQQDARS